MPEPAEECPICAGLIIERHCKRVCRNCGYTEDCSDLRVAYAEVDRATSSQDDRRTQSSDA